MKFDNYLLRPLNNGDVEPYFNLIEKNRKRLEDFFAGTVSKNKTINDTKSFIVEVIEKAEKRISFPFVIVNEKAEMVGYIDIKNIDWNIPKAEIGYFIDRDYEGKGISRKAVSKILEYCFDVLKLRKIFLRTHEANISSRKVAEKNGFEVEGIIRSDYKTTDGTVVDLMYYGLVKP